MDILTHFLDQIVSAVRAALLPKLEAMVGKMEAQAHQLEGLRADIAKLSAKIDRLGPGSDPALLKTLTDLTAKLHVSAATLQAAVAANPNP